MALVLVGLSQHLLRHSSRRDSWLLCPVHLTVLYIAFFGRYRAIVVIVYLLSIPSLFLMKLAIGRTVDPA